MREPSPPPGPTRVEIDAATSGRLRNWNLGVGLLMLVSSVAMFVLADPKNKLSLFAVYSTQGRDEGEEWGLLPIHLGNTIPGYYSAVFLLLAALDHLLVASVLRAYYERCLAQACNPIRWIEYSISASVMHVMVGQLSGVLEIHLVIGIAALTGVTMVFGYFQEKMNSDRLGDVARKTFVPFWIGMVPHLANWGIISSYFFYSLHKGDPPDFVYAILIVISLLDSSFALNMYLQQKEIGRWRSYVFGEVAFVVLSLTSKHLLAWLNFGGSQNL